MYYLLVLAAGNGDFVGIEFGFAVLLTETMVDDSSSWDLQHMIPTAKNHNHFFMHALLEGDFSSGITVLQGENRSFS